MKYITLLFISIFLSGCVTHMNMPTGGKENRILVLSKTKDQFKIVFEDDHPLMTFRTKTYETMDPGWALSGVFDSYVLGKQLESDFTLVSGLGESMPKMEEYYIHRAHKELFIDLAKKYNADHILLLKGAGTFKTDYGRVVFDAEYGYQNRINRPVIMGGDTSGLFLHTQIYLINMKEINDESKSPNYCHGYEHHLRTKSISLPEVLDGRMDINEITSEDSSFIFSESKKWILNNFSLALQSCSIIPDTRPKIEYEDDEGM